MDYIDELTDTPPVLSDEISETTEQDTSSEDVSIDTSAEQAEQPEDTSTQTEETQENGEESQLAKLQAELDTANGRMKDKDRYINELQNQKPKEEVAQVEPEEETDFWDDPETVYKQQNQKLESLQFQLEEQSYARDKPDYYDVVTQGDVNSALMKDTEFASEFNSSSNKFETAYTYLKKQSESVNQSQVDMREQIKKELMAEMGVKPAKAIPKSVSSIGSGNANKSEASEDGFGDVFGSSY